MSQPLDEGTALQPTGWGLVAPALSCRPARPEPPIVSTRKESPQASRFGSIRYFSPVAFRW